MRLDVSDNPMTGEAAPALAAMLARHAGLVALNLSDTALGDDGVSSVVQALHASSDSLQVHWEPRVVLLIALIGFSDLNLSWGTMHMTAPQNSLFRHHQFASMHSPQELPCSCAAHTQHSSILGCSKRC